MTPARIIVFVGPSFSPGRVHELVPSAEVRPPIRRGDLAKIEPPALVAIIDGVFDAELAVAPREIRNAIARGVRVVGSSSMGALRAAEVHEMIGVGRIYEMYRNGTLQRDDEVAVLLDTESGKALTEPLANIRFAVETLVHSGTLDEGKGAAIVEAASGLHFHDRVYKNVLRKAGLAEFVDAEHLALALRSIDLKREDAHTLLERLEELGADARWSDVRMAQERDEEDHSDPLESVSIPETTDVGGALLIWEFGEPVQWFELFAFLGASGKLDAHARRVLARTKIDDGPTTLPRGQMASVQDLFGVMMSEWGWNSAEEVHVTLNDLRIGFDDLQAQLRDERRLRKKLRALAAARDERFMRAVKLELLMTDMSLKRETMRLGALQVLAQFASGPTDPAEQELQEAKRALLCERPELTWQGVLDEAGMSDSDVDAVVAQVACARRIGVALLETMEKGPFTEGNAGAGVAILPTAPRAPGSASRSVSDEDAAATARKLGTAIGVTRVAQIGELERFGLHVTAAYRPSEWSASLGSGKSETLEGAVAGGLMEELEKYCQERFEAEIVAEASFEQLKTHSHAVDPLQCALPFDSTYAADTTLAWSEMVDLVTGENVLVPQGIVSMHRVRNDVLYSARRGRKVFSTNGLASGFTITEALVHALCERIERHAAKLGEQLVSNPGHVGDAPHWPFAFIDLDTCPASTQRILAGIRGAGYEARVMDITCEASVPSFAARIFRTAALHGLDDRYCPGACTHPNPELALNRALLEAVQTRVASLSGAREDFSVKARSLGRHERPRPVSRADAYWIRPHVPKKPLSAVAGVIGRDAREDLAYVVRRLTAAGFDRVLYRDLSRPEIAPARVVRAFVPGTEDTNPFHTGLRARTLMVQDLMRRHAW